MIAVHGPCHPFVGGVTAKRLMALADNCPNLPFLRVHFQVASLCTQTTGIKTACDVEHSISWTGCALRELEDGEIPMAEELAPTVALTLLRIFPLIETFSSIGEGWEKVEDMIHCSKKIVDCSSATISFYLENPP